MPNHRNWREAYRTERQVAVARALELDPQDIVRHAQMRGFCRCGQCMSCACYELATELKKQQEDGDALE